MNRQQAEHILDAYIQTIKFVDDEEPSVSLREVILDAMTEYKTCSSSSITYPITTPNITPKPYQYFTSVGSTAKVVD